ncbi:MAG: hypothetical protein CL623_01915 [Arcobacter sp.]|nr:hypothetical protein [Arcobacter sp.]|tara:strand:+ start:3803 stop:4666 length:864 start_codon:yes stop_codon:yes gene_type:complete
MESNSLINDLRKQEGIKYFSNIKNGRVNNDTVLTLITRNRDIENLLPSLCQYYGIMPNFIMVSMENVSEEALNRTDINTILISRKGIDNKKLSKSLMKPLIIDLKSESVNAIREPYLEMILQQAASNNFFQDKDSLECITPLAYYRLPKIMDLIYISGNDLEVYLELALNDVRTSIGVFKRSISFFRGKSLVEIKQWQEMIKNDLYLLQSERKLTCRLARLIYKVATLNDDISNTAIGKFFGRIFGIRSEGLYNKYLGISNVKGYDLNKSPFMFLSKYYVNSIGASL